MSRRAPLALLGTLLACTPEPAILVSEVEPGLRLLGAEQATLGDHFAELLIHAGHVYVADANAGVVAMRLEADGGLTLTDRGADEFVRCTTLAIHRASDTLYCAADDGGPDPIGVYDIGTPGRPVRLDSVGVEPLGARDIAVIDDQLVLAGFDAGLWTAAIDDEGVPGPLEPLAIEGNARFVVEVGDRVAIALATFEGTQLRLYDPDGWVELDRLALAGPSVGLSSGVGLEDGGEVDRPRLGVALGSQGAALVDVDLDSDQLTLARQWTAPGVVTQTLADGDLALVITLSGVFAFELGAGARMFGFGPESSASPNRNGNMLHGLLHEGDLITSDWTWVERWAIDPAGSVVALDLPRGVYLQPGESARWRMRNPGAVDLRAEFWFRGAHEFTFEVPAGSAATYELSAEAVAELMPSDDYRAPLVVRVHDPAVASEGEPLSISNFVLLWPEPGKANPPTPGQAFGPVYLADTDYAMFELPIVDAPRRVVWYSTDCALMWPEIEDLVWHERHGGLSGGRPVFISDTDVNDWFAGQWAIADTTHGLLGPHAPPEVQALNEAAYGPDVLGFFVVAELPGDGLTTDYELDGDGRVRSIERIYRGPWTLNP